MEKEKEERRRLRLSGKATAFCLVLAFLATGVMIPAVLRLPTWIEFEFVLIAWWAIWLTVLTTLLYQGKRVADDHQMSPPRKWFNPGGNQQSASRNTSSDWGGWYWSGPGGDAEGCAWIIGIIGLIIASVFLLWFLIEVAIPLVLFILYMVPRGMLSRVVNDRHHCTGRLGRSFRWALIWATVYTVPLAGLVWWVHFLLSRNVP